MKETAGLQRERVRFRHPLGALFRIEQPSRRLHPSDLVLLLPLALALQVVQVGLLDLPLHLEEPAPVSRVVASKGLADEVRDVGEDVLHGGGPLQGVPICAMQGEGPLALLREGEEGEEEEEENGEELQDLGQGAVREGRKGSGHESGAPSH